MSSCGDGDRYGCQLGLAASCRWAVAAPERLELMGALMAMAISRGGESRIERAVPLSSEVWTVSHLFART